MAHSLISSSPLHTAYPKTPISTASLKSQHYRGPSVALNLRNQYGMINGEQKVGDLGLKPLSSLHSLRSRNRAWLQNQSSTALFSSLTENVVSEDELEFEEEQLSWIDWYLPKWLVPYAHLARVDRDIGTWTLLWPFWWSITLAAPSGSLPDLRILALTAVGSVLWRGAACTINDFFDRDIDAKMRRTRSRPLACGMVTPFQGLCFFGLQLLLGAGIMVQLNTYSCILASPWPLLITIYPLMKRITYLPQAYLGISWSWSAFLGWTAVKGSLDPTVCLPIYLATASWIFVADSIYAHQDKRFDVKYGVKSSALLFGDTTKAWVTGFSAIIIGGLILSGYNTNIGWPFYAGMAVAVGHLAWQIITVDLSVPNDCMAKFISNKYFGGIVFASILLGRLVA